MLPEVLHFPAAIFLIVVELVVGLGLLLEKRGALTGSTLLIVLFVAVLVYALSLGLDIDCGCFGPEDPEALALHGLRSALYRDLLLLLVIVYLYVWRFGNRSKRKMSPASRRIAAEEA